MVNYKGFIFRMHYGQYWWWLYWLYIVIYSVSEIYTSKSRKNNRIALRIKLILLIQHAVNGWTILFHIYVNITLDSWGVNCMVNINRRGSATCRAVEYPALPYFSRHYMTNIYTTWPICTLHDQYIHYMTKIYTTWPIYTLHDQYIHYMTNIYTT